MRSIWKRCTLSTAFALAFALAAHAGEMASYVSFDVPGASGGTFPQTINDAGDVAGIWDDSLENSHGFIRTFNGGITAFDVPGASQTDTTAINSADAAAGYYVDASGNEHSFIFFPAGANFVTFDPHGSAGSSASGINRKSVVAGTWWDQNHTLHGYVRAPGGRITSFDPPGSVGTSSTGINDSGSVCGEYQDASGVYHGFTRAADGTITSIDPKGADGTFIHAINAKGDVTGEFYRSRIGQAGFLRTSDGTITVFAFPGKARGNFAQSMSLNRGDFITGFYEPKQFDRDGFLRAPSGAMKRIRLSGSQVTYAIAINDARVVMGDYADQNGAIHGFLRLP